MEEDATALKLFDEQLPLFTWSMSFNLFPFPASKLPSILNVIAEASRKCHHHLLIYRRLVIGLAALRSCRLVWPRREKMLHHMVFQINDGIMIPVFTSQWTVQVPFLSNFCPVVVSLYIQVISLCAGVPTHSDWEVPFAMCLSETLICRCRINPWLHVHRWMRMGLFKVRLSCLC